MTELELLQKIHDGEIALFIVLACIALLLGFWFGNRGAR